MIPIFGWILGFIAITAFTVFAVMEPYDGLRPKWILLPLALMFFPFLLREGTVETSKEILVTQVSAEGVPFIVVQENEDLQIVSLADEFGKNLQTGTKIEVYTEIGKYIRFFYGEETGNKYRLAKEEQK